MDKDYMLGQAVEIIKQLSYIANRDNSRNINICKKADNLIGEIEKYYKNGEVDDCDE